MAAAANEVSDESSFGAWDSVSSNDGESTSEMRFPPEGKEHTKVRRRREEVVAESGEPVVKFAGSIERLERLSDRGRKIWRERYAEVTNDSLIVYGSPSKEYIMTTYSLHGAYLVTTATEQRFSFTKTMGPSGIVKEGYLNKSSGKKGFKKWDNRWFVLTADKLSYRDSREDTAVKGEISLENVQLAALSDNELLAGKTGFEVVTPDRTFVLYAESDAENYKWVTAIQEESAAVTGHEPDEEDRPPSVYLQLYYGESLKRRADFRVTKEIAALHEVTSLGPVLKEAKISKLKANNKEVARYMKVYESAIHIVDPINQAEIKYRIPLALVSNVGPGSGMAREYCPHAVAVTMRSKTFTFFAETEEQSDDLAQALNSFSSVRRATPPTLRDVDLAKRWAKAIQEVLTADMLKATTWRPLASQGQDKPRSKVLRVGWLYGAIVNERSANRPPNPRYLHVFGMLTDSAFILFRQQPQTQYEFDTLPRKMYSLLGAEGRVLTTEEAQGKRNAFVFFTGNRVPIPLCAWNEDSMLAWTEALDLYARRYTTSTLTVGAPFTILQSAKAPGQLTMTVKRDTVSLTQGETQFWEYSYRQIKSYKVEAETFSMTVDNVTEVFTPEAADVGQAAYIMQVIDCAVDDLVAAARRVEGLTAMADEPGDSDEDSLDEWKTSDNENDDDDEGGKAEKKAVTAAAQTMRTVTPPRLNTGGRRGSVAQSAASPTVVTTSLERLERRGPTKAFRERYAEITNEGQVLIYKTAAKGSVVGHYSLHGGVVVATATSRRFGFTDDLKNSNKILKEGYLSKSSGKKGHKKFDRRWFKLTTEMIIYTQNQEDHNVKGEILLADVLRVNTSNSNRLEGVQGFEVVTHERTYLLYGDTDTQTFEWAKAVQDASRSGEDRTSKRSSKIVKSDSQPMAEGTIKEGYLNKSSGKKGFKKWDKRWFRLSEGGLTYKEKPEDKKDKGEIKYSEMMRVAVSTSALLDGVAGFEISTSDRVYVLYDDDVSSTYEWTEAIQEAIRKKCGRTVTDEERPPQLFIQLFYGENLRKRLDVHMADRGSAARWLNALANFFDADMQTLLSLNPSAVAPSLPGATSRIVHAGWLFGAIVNEKRRTRNILKWQFIFVVLTDSALVLYRNQPFNQEQLNTFPRRVYSLLGSESRSLTEREDRGRRNGFVALTGARLPIPFCAWSTIGMREWVAKIEDTAKAYTVASIEAGVTFPVAVQGKPVPPGGFNIVVSKEGVSLRSVGPPPDNVSTEVWEHPFGALKSKVEGETLNISLPDGTTERVSGLGGEIGQSTLIMQVVMSSLGQSTTNKRISQWGL